MYQKMYTQGLFQLGGGGGGVGCGVVGGGGGGAGGGEGVSCSTRFVSTTLLVSEKFNGKSKFDEPKIVYINGAKWMSKHVQIKESVCKFYIFSQNWCHCNVSML